MASLAGTATGATDTLDAAFLRPVQISAGQSEDDRYHSQNDEVFHSITFLSTVTPAQLPTFSLRPVRALYMVVLPLLGLPAKAILILVFLLFQWLFCQVFFLDRKRLAIANRWIKRIRGILFLALR